MDRLFAYDRWANRETLASLQAAGDPPARAVALMAHIAAAEQLWLDRLRQRPPSNPVWPAWEPDEAGRRLERLADEWRAYLDETPPEARSATISYTNSKGEPWHSRIEDVLMHVVLHSAYHRGQIASALRAAGHEPVLTDFIHAARQGLLP